MYGSLKKRISFQLLILTLIITFILIFLLLPYSHFILSPSVLLAQESKTRSKDVSQTPKNVTMDFDNVDIRLIIKTMSDLLGINFLIDDGVKGNVTIISPNPVSIDEAYKVFESILEVKGFAAVSSGSLIKIVPARDASSRNIEMRTVPHVDEGGPEDTLITQLIPIEHSNVDGIKNVIAPLVSKESKLITYPPTNTIILIDTASNIDRLLNIIKEIDIPSEEAVVKIIALKFASPEVISKQILSALEEGKTQVKRTRQPRAVLQDQAIKTKIIPDARTGSLIIVAGEDKMEDVLDLVESLDIPTPRGKDNIRVRPLKNSKAESIADVLGKILNQQEVLAKKGGPESGQLIQNSIVTADKSTNSLIITASPQDYEIIARIIDELDVMRPQVLVETLIAEVSLDKMKNLGVEWRTLDMPKEGSLRGFAGTNFGQTSSINLDNPLNALPEGISIGMTRGTTKIGGVSFPNIASLIRAYQKDSDVNILSTPHILTTDTAEATIVVGQEVPYQQSEVVDNITRYSYLYKDVGITLKLTPYINPDGYVKLEISLKIDELIEMIGGAPRTTNREAQTTVVVKNRQTVVLGGLLKDRNSKSFARVPFLGEIPILGWIFRNMSRNKEKINLQVFLTPHIIETPEDLQRLTLEKGLPLEMEYLDQRLTNYSDKEQEQER